MYLGCKCQYRIDDTTFDEALIAVNLSGYAWTTEPDGEPVEIKDIKLVLRRLSSMSEDEGDYIEVPGYYKKEFVKAHNQREAAFTPDQFQYLLSRGFDLFGLIDAGLAVEPVPTK